MFNLLLNRITVFCIIPQLLCLPEAERGCCSKTEMCTIMGGESMCIELNSDSMESILDRFNVKRSQESSPQNPHCFGVIINGPDPRTVNEDFNDEMNSVGLSESENIDWDQNQCWKYTEKGFVHIIFPDLV